MLDSGEMRTVDLSAATGIRFPDAGTAARNSRIISRRWRRRGRRKSAACISIRRDAKQREVVASYMIPIAGVEIELPADFRRPAGQPMLEGWAIVDNTTGEDWNKVQLSLVSGRPISFVSQLYAPKYVQRPEADLPDDAAAAPVVHAGGIHE